MTAFRATVTLLGSLAALVVVGLVWFTGPQDEPRADLVRRSAQHTSSSVPTFLSPAPRSAFTPTRSPAGSPPSTVSLGTEAVPGVPVSIAIPSLGIEAGVVAVGINDDGSMEIPDAVGAGWYRFGPRPGAGAGSAVLAGHVDHEKSPGVFFGLRRLGVGEQVTVTDDAGVVHRFAVTERFQVSKGALPITTLFRRDGAASLTLITCGGRFDRRRHQYDDNIVVRAMPVAAEIVASPAWPSTRPRGVI